MGQVIVFGRDFDTKVVMFRGDGPHGWAKWLASFVDDLESGDAYELGANADSEGSEDSVGYESYFFDGVGRGQGDAGGDAGTAGMRLAGEYKGWHVLEAWADRSVRKWQEAGVIPTVEEHTLMQNQVSLWSPLAPCQFYTSTLMLEECRALTRPGFPSVFWRKFDSRGTHSRRSGSSVKCCSSTG